MVRIGPRANSGTTQNITGLAYGNDRWGGRCGARYPRFDRRGELECLDHVDVPHVPCEIRGREVCCRWRCLRHHILC